MYPVNLLEVPSVTIMPGTYFYGWASIDERGTFNSRHLRMILFNLSDDSEVTDGEQCEEFLHEMVVNGSAWEGPHPGRPCNALWQQQIPPVGQR